VVPWPRIAPAATAREDVHLVAVDEAVGLPFDHDAIVTMARAALRDPYRDHPDPDRLLPSPFTLHELRALHEAVLCQALPKDTFRRHMQPQLRATTRYRQGVVGKPALLFGHPRTRT
jgi:8-oxo-dGTP diphosphatase